MDIFSQIMLYINKIKHDVFVKIDTIHDMFLFSTHIILLKILILLLLNDNVPSQIKWIPFY